MNPDVPGYVSIVFILTALLTVGIFLFAVVRAGLRSAPGIFLFAFGPMPFFVLTFVYVIFFRKVFLENMPLAVLTLIHTIRIPVEFVLLWLYQSGQVPVEMTFEGRNFDILSGITAPLIYLLAFRKNEVNRSLLLIWNLAALALLTNIVTIAVLAFPSPF